MPNQQTKEKEKTQPSFRIPGSNSPNKASSQSPSPSGENQSPKKSKEKPKDDIKVLSSYELNVNGLIVNIKILLKKGAFVPEYHISIINISQVTKVVLDKIKDEFVRKVQIGEIDLSKSAGFDEIKDQFSGEIQLLIKKYFPHIDEKTTNLLVNHLIQENIGLGKIDIILKDPNLEEIAVNSSQEPIWVYHRKHKWLKTNVYVSSEDKIRHYATMIGREIGKEITVLKPLMDAHLSTGDRVNSTLYPISSFGNTITIRKFAAKPWTITDFIRTGTIGYEAAAMLWLAVENELSILITGGTGSGKTSMLNVVANFFPPNQRIISIEDTREITLPKNLHWVPTETRLPNPEGKGEVTMLDLVVNSLRMRPDRVVVGEIRRKREAEVLFEAMHTGHSVYATLHANNAEETIQRLVNPPIEIPAQMLSAISLICVQYRNRRTGNRVTLQLAEVDKEGNSNVIMQYNVSKQEMNFLQTPRRLFDTITLYTGMTEDQIRTDLEDKKEILQWLVSKNINDIHKIGSIMAHYYLRKYTIQNNDS
jgi:flagellar protein FlaI